MRNQKDKKKSSTNPYSDSNLQNQSKRKLKKEEIHLPYDNL